MSHESIDDRQIKGTQNLPFEVIAVPQYNDSRLINSASNKLNEPVNVKIRIRNKDDNAKKHGIISAQKLATNSGRKVRLISSDQTIMSFDFFEDPNTTKKQQKKSHKNIFHIFRPGRCLKTQDNNDDEYHYSPNAFNVINDIKDPSSTVADQNNIISEKIILKKNFPSITSTNTNTKTTGNFMGKCKPGGCLDPPFNEDKYSYEPATATSNASIDNKKDTLTRHAKTDTLNEINNIKIKTQEISENIITTKVDNNAYQENYSYSLITYSSSSMDNFKIQNQSNDIKIKKRITSEDKTRISINEFSEIYFMPLKKDESKIKEKTSSKSISEIENNTMFKEENSKYFVANHQKSPTLTTDSSFSLDNDVIKLQSDIKSYEELSFVKEKNLEVKVSSDNRHTIEDINFSPIPHSSSECIDKNIISKTNSKIALPDKSDLSRFVDNKTYSRIDNSYNENKADSTVEIIDADKPISETNQQISEKESVEGTVINLIKTSSVRNQNIQNINENLKVRVSSDNRHTIEDIKFSPAAHSSSECIDKNIISKTNSKIALTNTDKSDISQFLDNKTYSKKDNSYNENKADYKIEIKGADKPISENNQQISEKVSVEGTLINEIKTSSVRNQDIQNINENYVTENVAEPVTGIKYDEQSLKDSQKLLEIEQREISYVDKIKSTQSEESRKEEEKNIDKNQNSNNVIPVLKCSEGSFKESLESIRQKLTEISKTVEIKDTQSKSEDENCINNIDLNNSKHDMVLQASESKATLAKTQETVIKNSEVIVDKNEEKNLFIANTGGGHLESSTSTSYTFTGVEKTALDHGISKGLEESCIEKLSEPDGVYDSVPSEHISIDILTSQESNYTTTNLNLKTKSITDIYKTSHDNELIISTPPETPTLKTSDVKFSLSSLIRDKRNKTNRNSFEEDKRDRTLERHKHLSLSKSLTSITTSEKNIDIDSNKHFNELNKSKSSLIHKISDQITEHKDNTMFGISEVIDVTDDKQKLNFNATDSYVISFESYETKQLESTGLGNLGNQDENSIKNQESIDKAKEKTDSIVQPSNENHIDLPTYSSVAIDFGFQCSIDNDNKLMIRSFDTTIPSNEDVKTNVSIIKSIIRLNGDEIRIPINFDTDLLMQIKKAEMTSKDLISSKEITPQSSDKTINKDLLLQETLNSVYENLIPLNKLIQNLKEEANALSRQQMSFKEILATMEMKPKRLIHTNPQCGCERK